MVLAASAKEICDRSHMKLNRKFWGFLVAAVVLVVSLRFADWNAAALLFDQAALIQFFSNNNSSPILSVGLFIIAHIIANSVGVPGTVLVVVGGAVYGLWWGTVWSVIGATLGAIGAFWLARYWLHARFQKRFAHRPLFKKMNDMLCSEGLSCVLLVRFSPVSPFNVVNFVFGLTPVPVGTYALGTLIGIIPGTMVYTWLGVTGAEAVSSGNLLPLFCCLAVLMMLSGLPLLIRRLQGHSIKR